MCTFHVETNVGSNNFQDRKIHRKKVFRPDLRLRSGQDISSPDVVLRLGRKLAPACTHAHSSNNPRRCGRPLGHLPSSCRLTLAHLDRHSLQGVVALRRVCVCFGFSNRSTTPLKNANKYIETLLLAFASRLVFYHTHCLEVLRCYPDI